MAAVTFGWRVHGGIIIGIRVHMPRIILITIVSRNVIVVGITSVMFAVGRTRMVDVGRLVFDVGTRMVVVLVLGRHFQRGTAKYDVQRVF